MPLQIYTKASEGRSQSTLHQFLCSIFQILFPKTLEATVVSCCCVCIHIFVQQVPAWNLSQMSSGDSNLVSCGILVLQLSSGKGFVPWVIFRCKDLHSVSGEGNTNSPFEWGMVPLQICICLPYFHTSSSRGMRARCPQPPIMLLITLL